MRLAVFALLTLTMGCSKASDVTEGRRLPLAPPPPASAIELPATLQIPVDIDGRAAPPINAHTLMSTAPDFKDAEHRAWKLATLLGPAAQGAAHAEIAAAGENGVAVLFPRPTSPGDPEPVLMANRRGEIVATMMAAATPFPSYHREGGRLRRPGDPTPHVARVTAIHVRTTAHSP
jgi:hypothetical protein